MKATDRVQCMRGMTFLRGRKTTAIDFYASKIKHSKISGPGDPCAIEPKYVGYYRSRIEIQREPYQHSWLFSLSRSFLRPPQLINVRALSDRPDAKRRNKG